MADRNALSGYSLPADATLAAEAVRRGQVSNVVFGTAVPVQTDIAGYVSTTSTSYVALSGDPGVVFVAPPSGRVAVQVAAGMVGVSSTAVCCMAFEVRTGTTIGSGTVVRAANDADRIAMKGVNDVETSKLCVVSGLTPGTSYNARAMYLAGGGTAGFARRRVAVFPQP